MRSIGIFMPRHNPFRELYIVFACRCFRTLDRVLPVRVIGLMFWPMVAFKSVCELTFATPTLRQFDRLPNALRPRLSRPEWIAYLWRERMRVNLTRLLCLWPDRLHRGRWVAHCRCV